MVRVQPEAVMRAVFEALERGESVVTATVMALPAGADGPSPGTKLLVSASGETLGSLGDGALEVTVRERALDALFHTATETIWVRRDGTTTRRGDDQAIEVLLEAFAPPATLLVVGGGHIGLSLATIGEHLGFSVTVLDDRPEYANSERFPMADRVICGDFEEELDRLPIDHNTYAVVVTRGHRQDEIGLRHLIGRGARYLGMIGSRRRVGAVLQHLREEGIPIEALEAVYTPIGIDIGAETPAEIAVSILAQIIQVRRGGTGRPMVERRAKLRDEELATGMA